MKEAPTLTERDRLQKEYLYRLEEIEGRYQGERNGMVREMCRWLARVDEAVDEAALVLGVQIPYTIDEASGNGNEARYNPAARLEKLVAELRHTRMNGLGLAKEEMT